jgi:hypothetical protein
MNLEYNDRVNHYKESVRILRLKKKYILEKLSLNLDGFIIDLYQSTLTNLLHEYKILKLSHKLYLTSFYETRRNELGLALQETAKKYNLIFSIIGVGNSIIIKFTMKNLITKKHYKNILNAVANVVDNLGYKWAFRNNSEIKRNTYEKLSLAPWVLLEKPDRLDLYLTL